MLQSPSKISRTRSADDCETERVDLHDVGHFEWSEFLALGDPVESATNVYRVAVIVEQPGESSALEHLAISCHLIPGPRAGKLPMGLLFEAPREIGLGQRLKIERHYEEHTLEPQSGVHRLEIVGELLQLWE